MRKAHSFRKSENYANLYVLCKNWGYFYGHFIVLLLFVLVIPKENSHSELVSESDSDNRPDAEINSA
ncbi:MAG: hypothetical protein MJ196_04640 [Treponemataceae bacterium]|nr:hypothetical protein [Treponemataceae bacterium]